MKVRGKKLIEEYISFSEKIDPIDLDDMKSILKKDQQSLLRSMMTLIFTLKKDQRPNFLVKLLGTNHDNSKNFLDMQKLAKLYDTSSYTEAFSESVGTFFITEIDELNLIGAPDTPILRQKFIKFQKDLRKTKQEYQKLIDEDQSMTLDYSFGNIEDVSDLSESQEKNRTQMLKFQDDEPEKFNVLWVSADYHLATIISRLENADYAETKLMREEILKRNQINTEIKDYGLTVSEILNGLQIAKKSNERYLYKAFSEGNINLKAMILILRSGHLIEPEDKFAAIKTLQTLCNDPGMYKISQDPERYLPVRRVIKKYNLPTHQNWKKEDQPSS